MSVTIDATAGGVSSNSFVTEAEATAYLGNRLNASLWVDGSSDNEKRALIEATRELTHLDYVGGKGTATQALMWPRVWAEDPDASSVLVNPLDPSRVAGSFVAYFATDSIPQRVKDATCELALEFLKAGTSDIAALDSTIGIQAESVGPISTTYTMPSQRAQGLSRFPRVMALVAPLLRRGNSGGLNVVRT